MMTECGSCGADLYAKPPKRPDWPYHLFSEDCRAVTEPPTYVVLRRWRAHPRDLIALFPNMEGPRGVCDSYEHIGQHGRADYTHVIQLTRPASEKEAGELLEELRGRGYNLKVVARRPS